MQSKQDKCITIMKLYDGSFSGTGETAQIMIK